MDADAIATELLDALDRNTLLAPIMARQPGFDVGGRLRGERGDPAPPRARGERPIGRKIGFTNRTVWPEYGAMWASVYDSTVTLLEGASGSLAIGHLAQTASRARGRAAFPERAPVTTDEAELLSHVDWVAHG